MLQLPKQGYFKRMKVYLAEMFPIPERLACSYLLAISVISFLGRIHGKETSIYSLHTLVGTWSIFLLMLILRLMDELKDREIDRELFQTRPLPSGKVLESDIRVTLIVSVILFLAVNIFASHAFWMAVFVLGYSLLMFNHFLIPRILRRSLLLTLTTHNPIIPMMLFYLLILFSIEHKLLLRNLNWPLSLLLIGMYWAMFFSWEIARKIRSKEEENAYVTYSQVFGRLGALLVVGGAQTIALAIGLYFFWSLSFSEICLAIILGGYGMAMWGHLRFVINPNPMTSKLKPFAEGYILSILVALMIARIPFA